MRSQKTQQVCTNFHAAPLASREARFQGRALSEQNETSKVHADPARYKTAYIDVNKSKHQMGGQTPRWGRFCWASWPTRWRRSYQKQHHHTKTSRNRKIQTHCGQHMIRLLKKTTKQHKGNKEKDEKDTGWLSWKVERWCKKNVNLRKSTKCFKNQIHQRLKSTTW